MENYQILEEVAAGRRCTVFKARRKRTLEYVAVKRLAKAELDATRPTVAALHALQSCANVLAFTAWYTTSSNLWMVVEYCAGGDLSRMLAQDGALPLPTIAAFAAELVTALAHVHHRGWALGHVRPSGILLDEGGVLKVADVSCAVKTGDAAHLATASRMTATALHATAPELLLLNPDSCPAAVTAAAVEPRLSVTYGPPAARGAAVFSRASDLFSLGVLLFELATGRRPFPGDTADAVMERIVLAEPQWEVAATGTQSGRAASTALTPATPPRPTIASDGGRLEGGGAAATVGASAAVDAWAHLPSLRHLVSRLLAKDPLQRCGWDELVAHAWWAEGGFSAAALFGVHGAPFPVEPGFGAYATLRRAASSDSDASTAAPATPPRVGALGKAVGGDLSVIEEAAEVSALLHSAHWGEPAGSDASASPAVVAAAWADDSVGEESVGLVAPPMDDLADVVGLSDTAGTMAVADWRALPMAAGRASSDDAPLAAPVIVRVARRAAPAADGSPRAAPVPPTPPRQEPSSPHAGPGGAATSNINMTATAADRWDAAYAGVDAATLPPGSHASGAGAGDAPSAVEAPVPAYSPAVTPLAAIAAQCCADRGLLGLEPAAMAATHASAGLPPVSSLLGSSDSGGSQAAVPSRVAKPVLEVLQGALVTGDHTSQLAVLEYLRWLAPHPSWASWVVNSTVTNILVRLCNRSRDRAVRAVASLAVAELVQGASHIAHSALYEHKLFAWLAETATSALAAAAASTDAPLAADECWAVAAAAALCEVAFYAAMQAQQHAEGSPGAALSWSLPPVVVAAVQASLSSSNVPAVAAVALQCAANVALCAPAALPLLFPGGGSSTAGAVASLLAASAPPAPPSPRAPLHPATMEAVATLLRLGASLPVGAAQRWLDAVLDAATTPSSERVSSGRLLAVQSAVCTLLDAVPVTLDRDSPTSPSRSPSKRAAGAPAASGSGAGSSAAVKPLPERLASAFGSWAQHADSGLRSAHDAVADAGPLDADDALAAAESALAAAAASWEGVVACMHRLLRRLDADAGADSSANVTATSSRLHAGDGDTSAALPAAPPAAGSWMQYARRVLVERLAVAASCLVDAWPLAVRTTNSTAGGATADRGSRWLADSVLPTVARAQLLVVKRAVLTSDDATICAALSPLLYLADGMAAAAPCFPAAPLTGEHILLALSLLGGRPAGERRGGVAARPASAGPALPAHAAALVVRLLAALSQPGLAAVNHVEAAVVLRKCADALPLVTGDNGLLLADSLVVRALDDCVAQWRVPSVIAAVHPHLTAALAALVHWASPLLEAPAGAAGAEHSPAMVAAARVTARACSALLLLHSGGAPPDATAAAARLCGLMLSTPALAAACDGGTADALLACCGSDASAAAGVATIALARGDAQSNALPAASLLAQDAFRQHVSACTVCGAHGEGATDGVHDDFDAAVGSVWCQLLPALLLAFLARVGQDSDREEEPAWEGAVLGCAAEVAATLPITACFYMLSWSPLTREACAPWLLAGAPQPHVPLHALIATVGGLVDALPDPDTPPPRAAAAVAHVAAILRALSAASDDFAAAYTRAAAAAS